jgi:hypothetical protein
LAPPPTLSHHAPRFRGASAFTGTGAALWLFLLLGTLLQTGCANILMRTGDHATMLVEDVLATLPRTTGRSTQEIIDALAGYDDADLAQLVRDAAREGVSGIGDGLEFGDGPLNEEITAFVQRVARSVVDGVVEEMSDGELEVALAQQIDAAMAQLGRSIDSDVSPEIEAALRDAARAGAQELMSVVTDPANVDRTNAALQVFASTMTAEIQRLLYEDVRTTADEIAINMGRALRTELAEPTIIQLNQAVEAWIDDVDGAVSEGFRQANSVLRTLSSVLGIVLAVVVGILLWVVRARQKVANELRISNIERERLELSIMAMARVYAESWALVERIEEQDNPETRQGDDALKGFIQAQLNEIRNSSAGVKQTNSADSEDTSLSRIEQVLSDHGRSDWLVPHQKFSSGPRSFEDWMWKRFGIGKDS